MKRTLSRRILADPYPVVGALLLPSLVAVAVSCSQLPEGQPAGRSLPTVMGSPLGLPGRDQLEPSLDKVVRDTVCATWVDSHGVTRSRHWDQGSGMLLGEIALYQQAELEARIIAGDTTLIATEWDRSGNIASQSLFNPGQQMISAPPWFGGVGPQTGPTLPGWLRRWAEAEIRRGEGQGK